MAAFCGFASWQLIWQGVHASSRACVGRVGVAWRQPKSRQVCAHFYESVAACYFGWIWKIMRHSSALLSRSVLDKSWAPSCLLALFPILLLFFVSFVLLSHTIWQQARRWNVSAAITYTTRCGCHNRMTGRQAGKQQRAAARKMFQSLCVPPKTACHKVIYEKVLPPFWSFFLCVKDF